MTTKSKMRVVSLADYLQLSADRVPKRTAVVNPDGTEISYEELNSSAERVAAFLAARGVGPGDRVAILLPKSAISVAAIFGILKTRAAYVPIDWTAPQDRILTILADCKTKAVFTIASLMALLEHCAVPPETIILTGPEANSRALGMKRAIAWE